MLKKFKIAVINNTTPILCQSCLEGKFVVYLQVVHTNLWDFAPCQSIDGYKFNVVFIDECTQFCWIIPLINKSDLSSTVVSFYHFVCTQFTTISKFCKVKGEHRQEFTKFSHRKMYLP